MTDLQDYDIDFTSIHTIKGHGLCRITIEVVNSPEDDSSRWEKNIEMHKIKHVDPTNTPTSWYIDVR